MSPRRPRRRARRRSPARPVVLLVAAVVVLALLIGGLTQVSRQSQGYDATSDRALAAQGARRGRRSPTRPRPRCARLMGGMPDRDPPGPAGRAGRRRPADGGPVGPGRPWPRVPSPLGPGALRVRHRLRRAGPGDGRPPRRRRRLPRHAAHPDRRTVGRRAGVHRARPRCSATQATNRIAAAGALLARSDALYRSVRRTLAAAAGPRPAAEVGVGHRPAAVAARHGGRAGRPHRHLARRWPPPTTWCCARCGSTPRRCRRPQGGAGRRVGASARRADLASTVVLGQQGLGRRTARRPSRFTLADQDVGRHGQPQRADGGSPRTPRWPCRRSLSASSRARPTC